MNIITKIKYCIYEGHRLNILTRSGGHYYTRAGLKVVASIYSQAEGRPWNAAMIPECICYSSIKLMEPPPNSKTAAYDIRAICISVLDGFVAADTDFLN